MSGARVPETVGELREERTPLRHHLAVGDVITPGEIRPKTPVPSQHAADPGRALPALLNFPPIPRELRARKTRKIGLRFFLTTPEGRVSHKRPQHT